MNRVMIAAAALAIIAAAGGTAYALKSPAAPPLTPEQEAQLQEIHDLASQSIKSRILVNYYERGKYVTPANLEVKLSQDRRSFTGKLSYNNGREWITDLCKGTYDPDRERFLWSCS